MYRLATILAFALSVVCLDAARPLNLEDYYKIENASAPAISPDGRWVVFVRNSIIETDNQRHTELWMASTDGSAAPVRLSNPASNASAPKWSPDGKLLSFRSGRRGGSAHAEGDIWFLKMDPREGEPFQIAGVGGAPLFSPDSHWIAFTKKTPPEANKHEQSAFEKQLDQRFKGRMYDWMNIRFDQRGYLPDPRDPNATPPQELYVVARECGTPRQLTHLGVDVKTPAWRPDSGALALIADSHQRDEYSYERADLWVQDLEGTIHKLTDDGYEYDSPDWSPDGRSLVFRRRQGLNQIIQTRQNHGASVDLYRIPATGGQMTNLTPDWDLIPEAPTSHGQFVYFSADDRGDLHLFRLASGGGHVEKITKGERTLTGFSFSAAFDRMAYAASDATHPAEVFSSRIDAGGEVKLSSVSGPALRDVDLTPAERIHFRSADGTEVEGWIMLPRAAKNPCPLILSIHGGPHGSYGSAFNYEHQLLTANGYAVLFTNPRGSTGYGEKFLWATWGGWGKLDYQDVMAGVDYAVGHYPVDANRLGVTGYSYGGFLTNWIITQTPRFVAAVTGAGISNWVSDYGTADIPRTKETEFYGAPWQSDSGERMRALSPISHVANVKTPTLFVHGEADRRVPIEEAEQMYAALKKLHVPSKFVRYPGNFHGGWPPWDMVHRYYQELQWWRRYLTASLTAMAQ